MSCSDVHITNILSEKGKNNTIRKGVGFATRRFKSLICVLTYKMHTSKEGISLLALSRSTIPHFGEHPLFLTNKHKYSESSQCKLDQAVSEFTPLRRYPGFDSYKYIPLPSLISGIEKKRDLKGYGKTESSQLTIDSLSPLRSQQALYPALCRERIREEKLFALKKSRNPIWKSNHRFQIKQAIYKKNATLSSSKTLLRDASVINDKQLFGIHGNRQTKHRATSKSIWKGFTNALMRNGSTLTYQTVLRKALLAASSNVS